MQRKNRDINIFSLSAIDLFCSGMGAIMVLMVLLMPYYMRPEAEPMQQALDQAREELASARQAEAAAREEVARSRQAEAAARSEATRAQSENAALRSSASKPVLAVAISWDAAGTDIDLHIVDPSGRTFYFGKKTNPGSPAAMEVDSTVGPGNELWLHPQATPGTYKIFYDYYSGRSPSVPVRGFVVYQGGRIPLSSSPVVLSASRQNNPVKVCELVVASDGSVTIR
jgi:hypothetical protein